MVFSVNSVLSVVKSFSLVRFRELPQKNHLLKKQNTNIILPAIETLVLVIFAPAKTHLNKPIMPQKKNLGMCGVILAGVAKW